MWAILRALERFVDYVVHVGTVTIQVVRTNRVMTVFLIHGEIRGAVDGRKGSSPQSRGATELKDPCRRTGFFSVFLCLCGENFLLPSGTEATGSRSAQGCEGRP
jgi:hypothetical protein